MPNSFDSRESTHRKVHPRSKWRSRHGALSILLLTCIQTGCGRVNAQSIGIETLTSPYPGPSPGGIAESAWGFTGISSAIDGPATMTEAPIIRSPTPSPTQPEPSICSNSANFQIVCLSNTTYNICLNGDLGFRQDRQCASGSVCCPQTNRCELPGVCVGQGSTSGGTTRPCSGVEDGDFACMTTTSYNYCFAEVPVMNSDIRCLGESICCRFTQDCQLASNCSKPLTITVTAGSPKSVMSVFGLYGPLLVVALWMVTIA